jgi:spoIIIJ-associated protein
MDQVTTNVKRFLDGLVEAFEVEGSTEVSVDDEVVSANITGQHGVLVGPKGRTLDAIQEITKIAAFKGGSSPARIRVDVGNYRAKRADALAAFATKAAEKARSEDSEVTLEPMSPADRKVVHDALSAIEGIETRSVGTDPRRRVVIAPLRD